MSNQSVLIFDNPGYLKNLVRDLNGAVKDAGGKSTMALSSETLAIMFGYPGSGELFEHGVDPAILPRWDHLLSQKELQDRHKRYLNVLTSRHGLTDAIAETILDQVGPGRMWRALEAPIEWHDREYLREPSIEFHEGLYEFSISKNHGETSCHSYAFYRKGPFHRGYIMRIGATILHEGSNWDEVVKAAEIEIQEHRSLCRTFINPMFHPAFSGFTEGSRRRKIAISGHDGVICSGEFFPFSWGIPPQLACKIPELLRPAPDPSGYCWYDADTSHIPMTYLPESFTTLERAIKKPISPSLEALVAGSLPATRKNVFLARYGLLDRDLLEFGIIRRKAASKRKKRIYLEIIVPQVDLIRSGAPALEPIEANLQLVFEVPEAESEPNTFQFDPKRHRLMKWRIAP